MNRISYEENWILGEEILILGEGNLDIGEGFCDISQRFSSLEIPFPECDWWHVAHGFLIWKYSTHNLKLR